MKKIIYSFVTLSITFNYTTTLGQLSDTIRTSTANPTTAVGIPLADTTVASAITQNGTSAPLNTGLTLTGFLDVYYTHDFTAPKTAQERPRFLYNHTRNREVNVNLAFIKVAYTHERVRGNLALQVGTYAQYNYAAEQDLVKNIFEANAGIKLSKTKHDSDSKGVDAFEIVVPDKKLCRKLMKHIGLREG